MPPGRARARPASTSCGTACWPTTPTEFTGYTQLDDQAKIVALIKSFGWALAPEKLNIDLGTRLKLLGFMLDTSSMTTGVPDSRRLKLMATAEFVLKNHKAVKVRSVCQLVGQVISLQLALGLVCRLRSRYLLLATVIAANGVCRWLGLGMHGDDLRYSAVAGIGQEEHHVVLIIRTPRGGRRRFGLLCALHRCYRSSLRRGSFPSH